MLSVSYVHLPQRRHHKNQLDLQQWKLKLPLQWQRGTSSQRQRCRQPSAAGLLAKLIMIMVLKILLFLLLILLSFCRWILEPPDDDWLWWSPPVQCLREWWLWLERKLGYLLNDWQLQYRYGQINLSSKTIFCVLWVFEHHRNIILCTTHVKANKFAFDLVCK